MADAGDWTPAFDDLLVERRTRCALCQAAVTRWMDIHSLEALAVVVSLCDTCHRRDADRVAVDRLLRARYHSTDGESREDG